MPSLLDVAKHWYNRPDWPEYPGNVDMGEPFCARCGWRVPDALPESATLRDVWRFAARWIDRAHLVDHVFDGSDDAGNMVPLCSLCHAEMPSYQVGQTADALAWVKLGRRRGRLRLFNVATEGWAERHRADIMAMTGTASRSWLRQMWVAYLELEGETLAAAEAAS